MNILCRNYTTGNHVDWDDTMLTILANEYLGKNGLRSIGNTLIFHSVAFWAKL